MDAVGLSNYAAAAGAAQPVKNAGATPKSEATQAASPGNLLNSPIADTVEISTPPATGTAKPVSAVFDPTATGGPYEQKHIGGALATSSAKDGFDGWDYMLKNVFFIEEGGNRTDMPHIYKYNYGRQGAFSSGEGYTPADALTNQERNLIANMYVYAHDNGLDMTNGGTNAISTLVWGMVNYAASGHSITSMNNAMEANFNGATGQFATSSRVLTQANAVAGMGAEVDLAVAGIQAGWHATGSYLDDNRSLTDAQMALTTEILSSSAMQDSLIPTGYLDNILAGQISPRQSLSTFEDIRQVIYAYSPSASKGKVSVSSTPSAQAQNVINWRQNIDDFWSAVNAKLGSTGSNEVSGKNGLTDLFGAGNAKLKTEDYLKIFDKYSDRVSFVASSLTDEQKSSLGMMYKMAAEKGTDAALAKVDQLAGALAAMNYMNQMIGEDNAMGTGNFWTQMLKQNQEQANEMLRDALQKRHDQASTHLDREG